MPTPDFSPGDVELLRRRGITVEEAERQLELLRHPPQSIRLDRPCRISDGITHLPEERHGELVARFDAAMIAGRGEKFVPASGAASRMFRDLSGPLNQDHPLEREALQTQAAEDDTSAQRLLEFFDNLERFAFHGELMAAAAERGLDCEALRRQGRYRPLLEVLLEPEGLDYANLPKGLIPFHSYPPTVRTPVEEQMVEAARHNRARDGTCRLHLTVPAPFRRRFEEHAHRATSELGRLLDTRFEVGFSVQSPSTDTLALDAQGRPFRQDDGSLLLRPGGHGALLGNLDALQGDVVFLKNIDNVLPDRLKDPVVRWKKILGGHLLEIRERIDSLLERLQGESPDEGLLAEARTFVGQVLCVEEDHQGGDSSPRAQREDLVNRLERPLRICGVVPNEGEPGGGPFWVQGGGGERTLQIVESAQVEEEQRSIFEAATHFNPVDLVCGLRDRQGRPFDLERYVDPQAVFIAKKSHQGRSLLALERPGLWNGAMAGWNTVFVEVPGETFAPVKTVFDLLRPEHQ